MKQLGAMEDTKMGTNKLKLYADIVLFVSFVAVNIPQSTGVPFHEWLSFLFIIRSFSTFCSIGSGWCAQPA